MAQPLSSSPDPEEQTDQKFKYGNDFYLEFHYSSTKVHKNMVNDLARTGGYRKAILRNQNHIKDKVIMDIGCGTGILSLFAVEAGAKRIIAVESVPKIAQAAKKIMRLNKVDHIVTVVEGKLEDLAELPDGIQKVDVIISEYLGYSIFVESMLDTIVFGRDKWLKAGGIIMPDLLSLNIFGFQNTNIWNNFRSCWDVVESPDREVKLRSTYQPMKNYIKAFHLTVGITDSQMVTNGVELVTINMNTITLAQLQEMNLSFTIFPTQNAGLVTKAHGLATYFEATFSKTFVDPVTISNAPWLTRTHWLNTIFLFDAEWQLYKGSVMKGDFKVHKNPTYPRDILFTIKVEYVQGGQQDLGRFQLNRTFVKA